eukprot:CAMPEP_0206610562 /NCGR_PEP_ID=MMETSP0325_2-20121206/54638_1 /ASSEMBLY_ACC=CAM_ASM_000347 /TAXON_ID=2866 /ORGANISM="Crypthecodinium cohnii, Strain Seligo" /LENGTH=107 /DNA_ID=CAMNT_0054129427 /DNA_START=229 /DNA_END=553 /DNA_ORIENTATION=+
MSTIQNGESPDQIFLSAPGADRLAGIGLDGRPAFPKILPDDYLTVGEANFHQRSAQPLARSSGLIGSKAAKLGQSLRRVQRVDGLSGFRQHEVDVVADALLHSQAAS